MSRTYAFIFNVFNSDGTTTSHIETFENKKDINEALDAFEAFVLGKTYETLGIYSEPSKIGNEE